MHIRRFIGLALIAGMPGIAGAQFTTFIPPTNKVADSVKAVAVAEQKAQQDSVAHTQLTNMRTWVDSAAGMVPSPTSPADSLARGTSVAAADSATFPNGARAPATASLLPSLLLAGIALLSIGVILVRAEAEPERERVRSPRA